MELYPDTMTALIGTPTRLRHAREQAGYSLRGAAYLIGTTHPTLASTERGDRELAVWMLLRAAAVYGVSPAWLLGMTEAHGPGTNDAEQRRISFYCRTMKGGA